MQQLIIRKDIDASKITVLLDILKSWKVDAEFKIIPSAVGEENKNTAWSGFDDFWAAVGMWKDYDIDSKKLREKAWGRNHDTL